jgi:Tol biopolymer transport system component
MTLTAGDRLGPYEILDLIGVGGMGEVYRAHDPRLKREVALKLLPENFANDPNSLARFQREAEVLASLNHPGIAGIYGVEESRGVRALVMELVAGETLAKRIKQARLRIETALNYARQIAEAIEYAHERGVVHRDLKPSNVMVTTDAPASGDHVKLLDFGLAKAVQDPVIAEDPDNLPTLTIGHTPLIVGTAAYMSPEQAIGKPADRRADIWSFGVVLFEMLTGRRAFTGESTTEILAAVVKLDADWDKLPAETPSSVRKLLLRCLTKDRTQRLQAIGEARIALEEAIKGPPSEDATATPTVRKCSLFAWALAAVMAGLALWGWLRYVVPTTPRPTRFVIARTGPFALTPIALSRDGSRLVIPGPRGQPIEVRMMDQLDPRSIPGTEGALAPCFSPDGQWIAYLTGIGSRQLKKVPVSGGAVLSLVEGIAGGPPYVSWGPDDNILFSTRQAILRVPSAGGKPQTLATTDVNKSEFSYEAPQLLPGGKQVLFSILKANEEQLAVLNVQTGVHKILLEAAGLAFYAPTGAEAGSGHIVYGRQGTLFAVPFKVNELRLGSPVAVLEGVAGPGPLAAFGFSDSGTLAYVPDDSAQALVASGILCWVDRQGAEQPLPAPPRSYSTAVQLSPDGGRVAFSILDLQSHTSDIWVYDLLRSALTRLTFEGSNQNPVWTADGERLIYTYRPDVTPPQRLELRSVPADSSGPPTTLLANDSSPYEPSAVSPDGRLVLGTRTRPGAGGVTIDRGIWVLPLQEGFSGKATPRAFLDSRLGKSDTQKPAGATAAGNYSNPQFSPDGRWVAYQSTETGSYEIYVTPYPGPGQKWRVSREGGAAPRWARSGRELFYRNGDKMMAAAIQTSPDFRASTPKVLFDKLPTFPSLSGPGGYDVTLDGKRFLIVKRSARVQQRGLHVVMHWYEELRARVPVK